MFFSLAVAEARLSLCIWLEGSTVCCGNRCLLNKQRGSNLDCHAISLSHRDYKALTVVVYELDNELKRSISCFIY